MHGTTYPLKSNLGHVCLLQNMTDDGHSRNNSSVGRGGRAGVGWTDSGTVGHCRVGN